MPVESSASAGSTCVPIKGFITATVNSSATATVQDSILRGLLKVVRQGMQDDVYVSGNIQKVSFIGSRTDTSNGFATDNVKAADANTSKPGLSGIGIAFLCVGTILFVALIALFIRKRYRRKAEERDMIFHDATLGAQKRALDQGEQGDEEYHSRLPALEQGIEGADIPGSLANKDALALKPDPLAPIKTGDIPIDDDSVVLYSPPRKGESLRLGENPNQVEYLADTQSFDSSDTGVDDDTADEEKVNSCGSVESAEPEAVFDKLVAAAAVRKVVPDVDDESVDEQDRMSPDA